MLHYRDILDLEYFCRLDEDLDHGSLHQRDREILLQREPPDESPESLIRIWLQARRQILVDGERQTSPGTILDEAMQLLQALLPLGALLIGIATGLAFFSYSGKTPVNVFHFLLLFVFSQFLLLLLLLLGTLYRRCRRTSTPVPANRALVFLVAGLAARLQRRLAASVPATARNTVGQLTGLLRQTGERYRALLLWPFFVLSQKTMVAFNLGLLAATLFKIATSDLAFGWQSTFDFSTEAIFDLVTLMALPWSWLVPENLAYPSAAAIEGSRIILKEGIYHLATDDLTAWWPFLVFCLLVYGLMLRLALTTAGYLLEKHALRRFRPERLPAVKRLVQRLRTPLVKTAAPAPESNRQPPRQNGEESETASGKPPVSEPVTVLLLIPKDLAEAADKTVEVAIAKEGFEVCQLHQIMSDYHQDRRLLQQLAADRDQPEAVLLLLESWLPPITETLGFLSALRRALAPATAIYLGMLGLADHAGRFSRPLDRDLQVWKQRVDGLGDPGLLLIPLAPPASPEKERDDS